MKKVLDGNSAASLIAYKFSELASIYPITPSSPMADNLDKYNSLGNKNLFGNGVKVIEMQSEAGAAGTMHGSLLSGTLTSTFTASQGLLLMIPNMYKIAGEGLPGVMHVAARTIATHALSIFGDHSDIYAVRQTGWCMLASSSVQQAHDLAAVTHLSAIKGSLPFVHFFDGFRTSHEYNKINLLEDSDLEKLIDMDAVNRFRGRALNINDPKVYGTAENGDVYFQSVEARNNDYNKIPYIVKDYMDEINKLQGTDYKPFNYYGDPNATNIIIAMGSVCSTIKNVISKLNGVGMVEVHLYRPFSKEYLTSVIPDSVKNIAVLNMTKEMGSIGEPLYLDVVAALNGRDVNIVGGRYGLSSKNVTPSDIYSVYKMLEGELKNNFTIGIEDDITNLSLDNYSFEEDSNHQEIVIYGYGSDGMVGASKDLLGVIGEEKYVQGYFSYDSKKSGGVTVSNLRFSETPIDAPYFVTNPSVMVVTKDVYLNKYNILDCVKENGVLIINTSDSLDNIEINDFNKKYINSKYLKVFTIDAEDLALRNNLKGKISMIFEAILLKLLGYDNYNEILEKNIRKKFGLKGEDIVNNNIACVRDALNNLFLFEGELDYQETESYEDDVIRTIDKRLGDSLPVSKLVEFKNGCFPCGTSKNEKRNISTEVPVWDKSKCIQCGQCALVCPHAVIRPFVVDENHEAAEEGISVIGSKDGKKYIISVSEEDCTSCGACINVCPGMRGEKALSFGEKDKQRQVLANTLFENHKNEVMDNKYTIKGSQYCKPKFEFSGACAGCGEAAYLKLLTQLFGDNLIIANATGCSSIYGGSVPSFPYSIPWANSLFEDNAEFGFGIFNGYKTIRNNISNVMDKYKSEVSEDVKELFDKYQNNIDDYEVSKEVYDSLKTQELPKELEDLKQYINKPSVWAVGGDGWSYDIGFSGIDHVLSSNENINILILDTEVYSNTGGQASKSSHYGQVAQFAAMGKRTNKKDMFRIAMSYSNVYVGSISLGANMFQTIKTLKEAYEHNGPSIVIAYSPCIEQGIKKGMSCAATEQKLAVECGYNILMRYNGEELFIDSKEPDFEKYHEFLNGEVRYNSLVLKNPELAKELLEVNKDYAKKRYNYYKNLLDNQKKED